MSGPYRTRAVLCRALPALVSLLTLAPAAASAQQPSRFAVGNEFGCTIDAAGTICNPQFDEGTWPLGTSDQYVYESGLVAVGMVAQDAGFAWAGDTIPAYFYDVAGTRQHGSAISGVFSSASTADLRSWPRNGSIDDFPFASGLIENDLYNAVYAGDRAVSELDTWTLYWEGNPARGNARPHPLGIAVEQRTMQWNAPEGLQSILFIEYRITNVTNLPAFRDTIVEAYFGGDASAVPAAGWVLDSVFVGFSMDSDVTFDATDNAALLIPSFGVAGAYHSLFQVPGFEYPPEQFHAPFFPDAPGLVASALLYADAGGVDAQTRIVSEYEGGSVQEPETALWYLLSGHPGAAAGVTACSFPDPIERGVCYLSQNPHDVRHYQSVGPWSLAPGEAATVVYAIAVAPAVETAEIVQGAENAPGIPQPAPGCGDDDISPLLRAAGWVSTPVCPAEGERVDPDLVETVPGSLLHRIQIARDFVSNAFLTPFAPERPDFYLVPSDSAVHVVWERSQTENAATGDPYYHVASDSTGALYNPNYRLTDVEGYRIYRSIDGENWELRAQFDYAAPYIDHLCETDDTRVAGAECTETIERATYDERHAGGRFFVQYRPGDVLETAQGQPIVVDGDTASAGYLPLTDDAPNFTWTDTDVRAGFRYFYQVRAFDLNSYRAGPSSLESGSDTKSIVIQADFANRGGSTLTMRLEGADGTLLDPAAPLPTLDSQTGTFSGPMPPTNGIEALLGPVIDDLTPDFRLAITIDSVSVVPNSACPPGAHGGGSVIVSGGCWRMHVSADRDGVVSQDTIVGFTPLWDSFIEPGRTECLDTIARVDYDSTRLAAGDAPAGLVGMLASLRVTTDEAIFNSTWEGQANRRATSPTTHTAGGSRWFAGAAETVADPAASVRVGSLPGIDTIWSPDVHHTPAPGQPSGFPNSANMQWWGYAGFAQIARAADLRVTWQNGTITVEDVTHHVPVPFDPSPTGQSWAFVQDGNDNGMIDDYDFFYLDGVADLIASASAGLAEPLTDPASAEPGVPAPMVMPTSIQGVEPVAMVAGAQGFGLVINTQRFIFRGANGGIPADGTVWTLRTYHGVVTAVNAETQNPSGYQFVSSGAATPLNGIEQLRPPFVPGLRVVFEGTAGSFAGPADLSRVHAVPDPYYFHSTFGATAQDRGRVLRFVNLPPAATIRIYSLTGILVDVIHHDDAASGIATWDLRTRDGNTAAPGVYFFHVTAPGTDEHLGRFTIVTSGRVVE